MSSKVLPLGFLQADRDAVVRDFNGGRGLHQRLAGLGIVCGNRVQVIKNEMGGPLIISVGGGRLIIGRGMALKIMVEEVSGT